MLSFEAELNTGKQKIPSKFYVIKGGRQCLIGKKSAIKLEILRIGLNINSIDHGKPFAKFKNIVVDIPIDNSLICQSSSHTAEFLFRLNN